MSRMSRKRSASGPAEGETPSKRYGAVPPDMVRKCLSYLTAYNRKDSDWKVMADKYIREHRISLQSFQKKLKSLEARLNKTEKAQSSAISFPAHIKEDDEESRAQQIISLLLRTLHRCKDSGVSSTLTKLLYTRLDDLWQNGLQHVSCSCGECVLCCNNTYDFDSDIPAAPISLTLGSKKATKARSKFPKQPRTRSL